MKLGLGLYGNILTVENFRFARQAGATHIVAHLTGRFTSEKRIKTSGSAEYGFGYSDPSDPVWTYEGLRDLKQSINNADLELAAIENFEPAHWYDVLLDGPQKEVQLEFIKNLLHTMGRVGIPVMGYNFSIAGVWGRNSGPFARGGAESVGFDAPAEPPIPKGMVWNMVYDDEIFDPEGKNGTIPPFSQEELWQRFAYFLDTIVPVAEEAGVRLALHPDDPPMPTLRGTPRLVYQPEHYQRVLDIKPSYYNGMEFCIGTLSEMSPAFGTGNGDIYDVIDRYSKTGRICYVHFRNVQGKVPHYHEVFVDEGDVDMIEALRILKKNNFDGVLIPDHTPSMSCDAPWHAGKAFALGFMKAVITMLDRE
ncbi:MAG: D-mannonate dehydratase [Chloroflexi bacterium]|nr:D-mannonate dehydratase [Chloroflexota bacterium]